MSEVLDDGDEAPRFRAVEVHEEQSLCDRLHSNEITLKKLTLAGGQFCKTHSLKLHGVSKHVLGDFLKNGPSSASFCYFLLFAQILQFLQQKNVKKCPSSKQCWYLKSQYLEYTRQVLGNS